MGIIGFENIRLFKRAEIKAPVANGGSQPKADKPLPPIKRFFSSPWTFLFLVVAVISIIQSYVPSSRMPVIATGDIAPADIVAPFDLIVEDTEATEKKKAEAENRVLPVYSYDPNILGNTEDKVRQLFAAGRDWVKQNPDPRSYEPLRRAIIDSLSIELEPQDIATLARLKFAVELEESLVGALAGIFSRGVVLSKNLFAHGERERGLLLVDLRGTERQVPVERVLDLKESEAALNEAISGLDFPDRSRAVLANLGSILLTPNANYNKIETEQRKLQARNSVGTVTYTVKKGRVIIRKGDESGPEAVHIVGLYNQRLTGRLSFLPDFAGSFLLYSLLFFALWLYLSSAYKKDQALNYFRMAGTLLAGNFILYKIFLALAVLLGANATSFPWSEPEIYYYAFPLQVGTLIFASLIPEAMAIIFAILNSLAAGFLLGMDLHIMVFSFLGGLAAFYGVSHFRKRRYRAAVLRASYSFIPGVYVLFLVGYHLLQGGSEPLVFIIEILFSFLGGVLSGALAFLFLPLVENSFGFITASKLIELTNTDLPIFKKMSLEAPGTYHHSLIISTLAEKAAEALGLDTRLVRAGALYHDIGKLKMPEYFIENQDRPFDMHRDLKPSMSTLVIINHVKEGVEMGRKLHLPRALMDIIEQHHGTSLVRFFYYKAKQAYNPQHEKIGEESYRYPGPRPKTKETALIMLADAVEAASRSLKVPTKEALKKVITDIFNAVLQDGQLDDCDFSLRELREIALSFLTTLFTIYHPRVSYPGFAFEAEPAGAKQAAVKEAAPAKEAAAVKDVAANEGAVKGDRPAKETSAKVAKE